MRCRINEASRHISESQTSKFFFLHVSMKSLLNFTVSNFQMSFRSKMTHMQYFISRGVHIPQTHTHIRPHIMISSAKEANQRQRDHPAPPADTSATCGRRQNYTSRTIPQWQHSRRPDRGEAPHGARGWGERQLLI